MYITEDDEHFTFTPNPTLNAPTWSDQYPPIVTNSPWLINKFTSEIVRTTPEFLKRSDCLEPYLGELPPEYGGDVVSNVNSVLKSNSQEPTCSHDETPSGELQTL